MSEDTDLKTAKVEIKGEQMNINEIVAEKTRLVEKYAREEREARAQVEAILANAEAEGRSYLTKSEDDRSEYLLNTITRTRDNRETEEAALSTPATLRDHGGARARRR